MNVLILLGNPRLHGNTAQLCKPFMEELKANGAVVQAFRSDLLWAVFCAGRG